MKSHKTSKYLTSRALLGATAFTIGLATQPAWSGVISYNFSENATNQVLDNTTPKGPLNTTFWNDSNAEGAGGTGTESGLVDENGTATSAAISWNSSNTWSNGSGVGSENARIVVGYLDDGGTGVSVNLTNIPYAKYNVYGIVGSDQSADNYTTVDFNVNGQWAFPTVTQQLVNTGSLGAAGNTTVMAATVAAPGALAGSSDPAYTTTAGQIIKVPHSAALSPAGPFTIEAWLKPEFANGAGALTCALGNVNVADPRSGWLLYQSDTGWNFRTYNQNGTATAVSITTGPAPVAGTWYHVVATWNGSVANVYVDGVAGTPSPATTFVPSQTADFHMGSRSDGAFVWNGSIDEVAFYGSALSPATIASHHSNGTNAGRSTPYATLVQASNPIGYWTGNQTPVTGAGSAPAFSNWGAAGEQWVRINPATAQRGNYWKVNGVTGSTLTIQSQARQGANRGSLSAVIVEEFFVPDKLVRTGVDTFAEVALGAGLTSEFRPGTDQATVTTADALSVAATHNISIIPEVDTAAGTYKLIDYDGSIGGAGYAGLALTPIGNSRYGATLVNNTAGSSVDLVFTPAEAIVWTGGSGIWNTAGATNWKTEGAGTPTTYQPYDTLKFDDMASTGDITISGGAKTPLAMEFTNSTRDYKISGDPITGATGLLKQGTGLLTLTNENTFTGEILVVEGKLKVGDGTTGSISPAASPFIASGAELELALTSGVTFPNDVTNEGSTYLTGAGEATISGTLSGGGFFQIDRSAPVTMSGSGYEGAILVKSGSSLIASGGSWATSFFGAGSRAVTLESGASMETGVHSLGGLGAAFNQPTITLEEGSTWTMLAEQYLDAGNLGLFGGTVEIQTNDLRLFAGVLAAGASTTGSTITGGSINLFGDVTLSVDDGSAADDFTIASNIVQNGENRALTKLGGGTLVFNGTASHLGVTTITEGTLKGTGTLAGPLILENGTTFIPGGTAIGTFGAGSATISGTVVMGYDGAAPQPTDKVSVAGALDVTGGTLSLAPTGAALTGTVYPLFEASSVTGTFASVSGTPVGYNLTYQAGGIFLLKSGANPYMDWATGAPYNLSGSNALATADPDSDGIPNAIEFVIGGNPTSPGDRDLLPIGTVENDHFVFNFPRSDDSVLYGPTVEYGSDLDGWTNAVAGTPAATPVIIETVENGFEPGIDAITVKVPRALATGDKLFARLKVTVP